MVTDNKPLSLIFGKKKGIPTLAATRIQRWVIKLAAYNYSIKHCSANQNCSADALSRLPLPADTAEEKFTHWTDEATEMNKCKISSLPIIAKQISNATQTDPVLSRVAYFTMNQ